MSNENGVTVDLRKVYHRQPASGSMDRPTAEFYVEHTHGQFEAFERDGNWFLCVPDRTQDEKQPTIQALEGTR